jgi:hypothetical protein
MIVIWLGEEGPGEGGAWAGYRDQAGPQRLAGDGHAGQDGGGVRGDDAAVAASEDGDAA